MRVGITHLTVTQSLPKMCSLIKIFACKYILRRQYFDYLNIYLKYKLSRIAESSDFPYNLFQIPLFFD